MKRVWSISLLFLLLATAAAAQELEVFGTRSIVACDAATRECAGAVVSFPTGVPAIVLIGEPGILVANQASPLFDNAERIISRIKAGETPQEALDAVFGADPRRAFRQTGVAAIGRDGVVRVANFTGGSTIPEVCAVTGANYTVQANLQNNAAVCQAMATAFENAQGSLPMRVFKSLEEGGATGQDARGEFSAHVRGFSDGFEFRAFTTVSADAAVQRSANWLEDLDFDNLAYQFFWRRSNPADLVPLERSLAKDVQRALKDLGFYRGPVNGFWSDETEEAWLAFHSRNSVFRKPTVVVDGVRHINLVAARYLILAEPRGVVRGPA